MLEFLTWRYGSSILRYLNSCNRVLKTYALLQRHASHDYLGRIYLCVLINGYVLHPSHM